MKLDIPYYIRQVLREQRMVHVPGIGTFRLNQSSANFNDNKTVISPPSLHLSFDDVESEDESLLKYILDTGQLTETKAKKKIADFTQSAFNKLLNVDSFLIDGVGTIIKKAEANIVEFEPNVTGLTKEYSDLPSLNLTPLSRIAEQQPIVGVPASNPKIEESGSFLPRIILLSLFLIALWFVGKHLYSKYNSEPEMDNTEFLDDGTIDEGITEKGIIEDEVNALAASSEEELQLKYEEIDELIDPLKKKEAEQSSDPKLNEELNNLTEKIEEQPAKEVENSKIADEESVVNEIKVEEPTERAESKSPDVTKDIILPVNKHANIIPETGECIIVVGSFIKSLNTIKMISLLERKGYKVYQNEYKGFTRVGLKYECSDEDLEAYLHNIRKNISKRAWYLDPDLVVPYLR